MFKLSGGTNLLLIVAFEVNYWHLLHFDLIKTEFNLEGFKEQCFPPEKVHLTGLLRTQTTGKIQNIIKRLLNTDNQNNGIPYFGSTRSFSSIPKRVIPAMALQKIPIR